MAYTIEQSPGDWVWGSKYPIIYTVYDDTNTGEPKFKYVCDVYVGGSKVARLKTLPNENDYGVFQLNRVIDDYLTPTRQDQNGTNTIAAVGVGTATPYSHNLDSTRRVEFRFGTEQATTATDAPTLTADRITGEHLSVIKAHRNTRGAYEDANAYGPINLDSFEHSGADPFLSTVPSVSGSASILSTSVRYDQDIELNQFHTFAFLNDGTNSGASTGVSYIHITGYTSAGGTVFTSSIQNTAANGGEPPTTSNSDPERLLYFGSGSRNLAAQTLDSTISTGMGISSLAYYEIVGASSATLNTTTQRSAVYRFNIKSDCKYTTRRIMFLNQYGGWDFFNFNKRSEISTNMERTTYKRVRGNWANATDNFGWDTWDAGTTTTSVKVGRREKLNTDWITEDWVLFMEGLFASREVYLIQTQGANDSKVFPVTITNTDFLHKSSVNDQLVQYEIEVEYGNNACLG